MPRFLQDYGSGVIVDPTTIGNGSPLVRIGEAQGTPTAFLDQDDRPYIEPFNQYDLPDVNSFQLYPIDMRVVAEMYRGYATIYNEFWNIPENRWMTQAEIDGGMINPPTVVDIGSPGHGILRAWGGESSVSIYANGAYLGLMGTSYFSEERSARPYAVAPLDVITATTTSGVAGLNFITYPYSY